MFNDKFLLTDAVEAGEKTMTRRIIGIDEDVRFPIIRFRPLEDWERRTVSPSYVFNGHVYAVYNELDLLCHLVKPMYEIGEVVAVAQSYDSFYDDTCDPRIFPSGAGWTNKMFVKAELMPLRIEITDCKFERLQDISDEDCLKEGIYRFNEAGIFAFDDKEGYVHSFYSAREAFSSLIDKVSGKGTFASNPYVFAYEFKLVD
jgi:hypothetical protein